MHGQTSTYGHTESVALHTHPPASIDSIQFITTPRIKVTLKSPALAMVFHHWFLELALVALTLSSSDLIALGKQEEESINNTDFNGTLVPLTFLLLGDWGKAASSNGKSLRYSAVPGKFAQARALAPMAGGGEVSYQADIAKAMSVYAEAADTKPSFVVALGDNFYNNGVQSTSDSLWNSLWVNMYLTNYAYLRVPWYPVFGNHDYGYGATGIRAQIERSAVDQYWSFDSTNYTRRYEIPSGGSVQIVFIDTTTLAPSENKCCNSKGGVSVATQNQLIRNQINNIVGMLETATQGDDPPTWLLVAGHYPVFSAGDHGDIKELNRYLLPILRRYKVHAYFCGHDHISEHLSANETEYFVVGAGSMIDYLKSTSAAELRWYGVGYTAFAGVTVTSEELTVTYIDTSNTERYSHTLRNPRPANDNAPNGSIQGQRTSGDLDPTQHTDWSQRNAGSILGSLFLVLGAAGILVALLAHKNNLLGRRRQHRELRNAGLQEPLDGTTTRLARGVAEGVRVMGEDGLEYQIIGGNATMNPVLSTMEQQV